MLHETSSFSEFYEAHMKSLVFGMILFSGGRLLVN